MSTAKIALLEDRGVISVSGADARSFLDNLITNDMALLEKQPAIFTALLTPQGKILFEFFVIRFGDGYLLETQRDQAAALAKRLSMYKLRASVEITNISESQSVGAAWGLPWQPQLSCLNYCDPRHQSMWSRFIISKHKSPGLLQLALSAGWEEASIADYDRRRVDKSVPEGGKDYALGDAFPHEANHDLLDGVSFTKGCFVGQEVVARMHNKTVVRKRVVKISGTALTSGAELKLGDAVIGTVGTVARTSALALLRLDRAAEAEDKNLPITVDGVAITIAPEMIKMYRDSVANKPVIDL